MLQSNRYLNWLKALNNKWQLFNGNKNIHATDRAHSHPVLAIIFHKTWISPLSLDFLIRWSGSHSLVYKKFQDFSRTSTTFSQDSFIVQQCLNIQTNGSYLLYIHWVTVPTIAERSGRLVGWLEFNIPFSAQIQRYQSRKIRGGELSSYPGLSRSWKFYK